MVLCLLLTPLGSCLCNMICWSIYLVKIKGDCLKSNYPNRYLTRQIDSGSHHDYNKKPMYLITAPLDFSKRPLQPKQSPLQRLLEDLKNTKPLSKSISQKQSNQKIFFKKKFSTFSQKSHFSCNQLLQFLK